MDVRGHAPVFVFQDKTGQPGPNLHLVKLVCNNRACGNIIGKAGAASKALAQATGVRFLGDFLAIFGGFAIFLQLRPSPDCYQT